MWFPIRLSSSWFNPRRLESDWLTTVMGIRHRVLQKSGNPLTDRLKRAAVTGALIQDRRTYRLNVLHLGYKEKC